MIEKLFIMSSMDDINLVGDATLCSGSGLCSGVFMLDCRLVECRFGEGCSFMPLSLNEEFVSRRSFRRAYRYKLYVWNRIISCYS